MNSNTLCESGFYGQQNGEDYDDDQLFSLVGDETTGGELNLDVSEPPLEEGDTKLSFVVASNAELTQGVAYTTDEVMAMTFDSEVEAYDWYNLYGLLFGFGITRNNCRYFDEDTKLIIKARIFMCARQGLRTQENLDRPGRIRDHPKNTRCRCTASIRIARKDPTHVFTITRFQPNHNHEPSQEPSMLRSHRKVKKSDVEHIRSLKEVGIKTSQAFQLMVKQAGGYGNVGYGMKDLYNKMDSMDRIACNKGDSQSALMYLDGLKDSHFGIFKRFRLGKSNELLSLFWCDRRSQVDYDQFGDVLVLDATYKTNMYSKPLVILSGVNNHYQTTVFACGFLNDETTDTYVWVLECLMEAMRNKHPVSVITDGDLAMRNSIQKVFPNAKHRLCSWHIFRNAKQKLRLGKDFLIDFRRILLSRKPIVYWNEDWQNMVDNYDIADRHWIQLAYSNRHMWAEAFLKYHFFIGQTSTSRSESINHFFKHFTSNKNKLTDLVKALTTGIGKLRDNERLAHNSTDQSNFVLTTEYRDFESHAQTVYTATVFKMFRTEAQNAPKCTLLKIQLVDERAEAFYVLRGSQTNTVQVVQCARDNSWLCCTCMMFESSAMICKHIIFVMRLKGLTRIPIKLVSDRWRGTSGAFYCTELSMREPVIKPDADEEVRMFRRGSMQSQLAQLNTLGSTSQATFQYFKDYVSAGIAHLQNMVLTKTQSRVETVHNPYGHVGNPIATQTKYTKQMRGRCGRCREHGHYRNTCPYGPEHFEEDTMDQEAMEEPQSQPNGSFVWPQSSGNSPDISEVMLVDQPEIMLDHSGVW